MGFPWTFTAEIPNGVRLWGIAASDITVNRPVSGEWASIAQNGPPLRVLFQIIWFPNATCTPMPCFLEAAELRAAKNLTVKSLWPQPNPDARTRNCCPSMVKQIKIIHKLWALFPITEVILVHCRNFEKHREETRVFPQVSPKIDI